MMQSLIFWSSLRSQNVLEGSADQPTHAASRIPLYLAMEAVSGEALSLTR
jgi:hypothetical protein